MDKPDPDKPAAGLKTILLGRLVRAFAPALPSSQRDPANDSDDSVALFEPNAAEKTALLVHVDATLKSLRDVVKTTAHIRHAFDRVVYVTDEADFAPLREKSCIFEYVPSRAEQASHAPAAPWSDYLLDRMDLLVAKWMPSTIISAGVPFQSWIDAIKADESHRRTTAPADPDDPPASARGDLEPRGPK